jgi:hypothetical protein
MVVIVKTKEKIIPFRSRTLYQAVSDFFSVSIFSRRSSVVIVEAAT